MNEKEMYPQQKQYDKGSAPKITREMVQANIWSHCYVNAYEAAKNAQTGQGAPSADLSRVTLCLMTLRNGAVIVGSSTCAHIDNFNQDKGESAAYDDAFRQAWNLMGYALRDRLGSMSQYQDLNGVTRDADGEESFEQLKWATNNDPRARPGHEPATPAYEHRKVNVGNAGYNGEPSPGATELAAKIAQTIDPSIKAEDIQWVDMRPMPTKAEKRRAMSFFDFINPGLDAWFGTSVMKDGEPVGKLKNVRMEDGVMRAEVEFDAQEDVVLKTSILGEFNYDSVMEAMKQAHEQAIKGASAAYRIPERLLQPKDPWEKNKRIVAKGAHDALHNKEATSHWFGDPVSGAMYMDGYNAVKALSSMSLAESNFAYGAVRAYCCQEQEHAEQGFLDVVRAHVKRELDKAKAKRRISCGINMTGL